MSETKNINILGVNVDVVGMDQAVQEIEKMIKDKGKHYVVTPNVEFIVAAQKDIEFRKVLNQASLAVPDSARFSWTFNTLRKNLFGKLLYLPLVFFPSQLIPGEKIPVTTGTDLLYSFCERASEKGFSIGLIGGKDKVADKAAECLKKKYKNLQIVFVEEGPNVDLRGNASVSVSEYFKSISIDTLFVGFGQIKQEKWIAKNLDKLPVKVAVGVGGAFDYISGNVPRAPFWLRSLGLEWLFRLLVQPWRIKRQLFLVGFVGKVLTA